MERATVSSQQISIMLTDGEDTIVFELQQSERSYRKRVLKMWNVYNLWLILGGAISMLIHGYSFPSYFLVFLSLSVLALMYSCIKRRQILLQLAYHIKSDTIQVSILRYNTPRQILHAPQKEVKLQVRKRYRYRYPIDCLVILFKNKEIYVQEEVLPSWTPERFNEIDKYFKKSNKTFV